MHKISNTIRQNERIHLHKINLTLKQTKIQPTLKHSLIQRLLHINIKKIPRKIRKKRFYTDVKRYNQPQSIFVST
jgi:hypothetical protein